MLSIVGIIAFLLLQIILGNVINTIYYLIIVSLILLFMNDVRWMIVVSLVVIFSGVFVSIKKVNRKDYVKE